MTQAPNVIKSQIEALIATDLVQIVEPRQVFEVRVIGIDDNSKRIDAGYFDDIEQAAKAIAKYDGRAEGIYIVSNEMNPALLARAANRIKTYLKSTTSDADIKRRRWFLIDCDPVRPAGISSTDEEHEAAIARMDAICEWLSLQGWPDPIRGDSGNGAHALYSIDLLNDPDISQIIERCLKALSEKFSDGAVKIDTSVYNPARIWKCYGTKAGKGDSIPTRPHRRSALTSVPKSLEFVTLEQLTWLASMCDDEPQQAQAQRTSGTTLDVGKWLESHNIGHEDKKPRYGGHVWKLDKCHFSDEHADGAFVIQFPSGAISAGCHHDRCKGKGWRELRALYDGKWEERAKLNIRKRPAAPATHTNSNGYHADDQDSDQYSDQSANSVEAASTWPYSVKNGRMMHTRINEAKDGTQTEIDTIIADFIATIVGEQIDESGDKVFVIEGRGLRCGHFRVEIPSSDYGDTGKLIAQLESVSSRDPIHPEGRRHIGAAIKKLTDDNLWQEKRFTRTGWDVDKFLIRGREPKGIRIDLPRKLGYQIDPIADLGKGLQALASIIQSPGAERGAIIMSHMLLAPMAYLARWRNERSGIFIKGRSGTWKTTTTQNFMAVYGAGFLEDETLVRWGEGATRNAIMKQAASTDDMPFPIDNFKPGTGDGAKGFVNLVHAMMEGGEKDRLNRSSELRESKPILCWPVFTGEDIPDTDPASLARLLVIQFESNGAVENAHLSNAQIFGHHLSAVGGAWLDWLESPEGREQARLAGEALPIRRDGWARWLRRTAPNMINAHRVATNLATNELAFEVALRHPTIGPALAPFAEAHGRGLRTIAQGMGNYTAQSLEAARYLQALRELLSTGRAVLQTNEPAVAGMYKARMTEDVERERLQDRLIGWSDGAGGAYLFPGTARQAVAKLLGDNLGGISDNTLFDQLKGLNAIHVGDKKTTFVKWLGGSGIRVLHVLPTALSGGDGAEVFS